MPAKRLKLPLGLVIASAITVSMAVVAAILMVSSYSSTSAALISAANDHMARLNLILDARVKAITEKPEASLQLLSHSPLIEPASREGSIQRMPALADLLDSSELISAVYAGYENGNFLLLRKLPPEPERSLLSPPAGSHYVLQQIHQGPGSEADRAFWQFYSQQRVLLEHRPMPEYSFDPRTRDWYRLADNAVDTVVTLPYMFFTTREIGVTMARRGAGTNTVIGLDATLADLSRQLQGLRLTPGTELAIIDKDNTLLAHPDTTRLADQTRLQRLSPMLADNPSRNHPLAMAMTLPEDGETHRFQVSGEDWYGMSGSLSGLPTGSLRYMVAVPERELLTSARTELRRQLIASAVLISFLLIPGWWLGRRIARPIDELYHAVQSFRQFNFYHEGRRTKSRVREVARLDAAVSAMANTIRGFQILALTMNREPALDKMLQGVLEQLLRILGQRCGAIYLFDPDAGILRKTASVQALDLPGQFDRIPASDTDSDLTLKLRVHFSPADVISVLRDRNQQLTGVLVIELEGGSHSLSADLVAFLTEASGAAAVAIETRQLIEAQKALLDGVIRLIADAVDAKSPYTSGHCERVPQIAGQLVDLALARKDGAFAGFSMSGAERDEFRIATWLHDCGKITSPEHVVDKASKLETLYNRVHEIRTRFEVLHRDAEIACLKAQLAGEDETTALARMQLEQQALQQEFALVAEANHGSEALDPGTLTALQNIARRTWQRHFSNRLGLSEDEQRRMEIFPELPLPVTEPLLADHPWHKVPWENRQPPVRRDDPQNRWGFDMEAPALKFDFGELYNLSVNKGTLTDEERFHINDHIVQTVRLLSDLPLPPSLKKVPRLAGTHHERVDGAGYPFRLTGSQMSIPEKIMAVADVFEALTAYDRPYKNGKTLSETFGIMTRMAREGHLDPEVFQLFLQSDIWKHYALDHLKPEQSDQVRTDILLRQLLDD